VVSTGSWRWSSENSNTTFICAIHIGHHHWPASSHLDRFLSSSLTHTFGVGQAPQEQVPLDATRIWRVRIVVEDNVGCVGHDGCFGGCFILLSIKETVQLPCLLLDQLFFNPINSNQSQCCQCPLRLPQLFTPTKSGLWAFLLVPRHLGGQEAQVGQAGRIE
jgi:hypothetical protein